MKRGTLRRLSCAVIALVLTGLAGEASARVTIEDSGTVEDTQEISGVELTRITRTLAIKAGGGADYTLQYRAVPGPDITGEKIDEDVRLTGMPRLGDPSVRSLGIGLVQPGRAAFYWGGFLGVDLDGVPFRGVAREIRVSEGDSRGFVEFIYEEDWGGMTLKFVQLAADDKLFLEIELDSEEKKRIGIRLISLPGHLGSPATPRNRWVATPQRSLQHSDRQDSLEPEDEYWVLSFDANDNKRFGSCAFLYLPEQVERADINLTSNYVTHKELTLKEGIEGARLILWNFRDEYRPPELAYGYLSGNGPQLLEQLRGFEFQK